MSEAILDLPKNPPRRKPKRTIPELMAPADSLPDWEELEDRLMDESIRVNRQRVAVFCGIAVGFLVGMTLVASSLSMSPAETHKTAAATTTTTES